MRTQNKKTITIGSGSTMIAFLVPQVFTAWAYINIVDLMKSPIQVEIKND